jgi:protein-S-isoprenylcysteine O-methyltransferase Ste14
MNTLENRLPPPLLLLAVALVMWAGGATAGLAPLASLSILIGGGAVLIGAGIVVAGFAAFRRAGTTIDPVNIDRADKLVVSGIFGFSRNPMYVGFTLALVGWSLILGNWWTLLGPAFYVLFIQRFQIMPEERVMMEKFGEQYAIYRRRVRRWI